MLNQVILVGKIHNIIHSIKKLKGKVISVRLTCPRPEDNTIIDNPKIIIPEVLSEQLTEYLTDGQVLGVKGRIQTEEKGNYNTVQIIVAEKVTFINPNSDDHD